VRRNANFDSGIFRNSLFDRWSDLRLLGHEYNWAVPGATARMIRNLLTNQNLDENTNDPDLAAFLTFAPDWAQTSARVTAQVQTTAGAVVIWCGGNDLRFGNSDPIASVESTKITYSTIYSGNGTGLGNPQPLIDSLRQSIQAIALHLRNAKPTLPIAVCAVPHIGCAPDVQATSPTDPVRTGRLTSALEALNADLKAWTEGMLGGAWVDIFTTTAELIGPAVVTIGGVTFFNTSDTKTAGDPPAAHNRYLFSHDGFHPGTATQAVVAQRVQAALRAKYPVTFGASAPLTDREIVVDVLGIPASTGFAEFMTASGAPAGQRGPADDADGDSLNNLGEFALAGNIPFGGSVLILPVGGFDSTGPAMTLTWIPRFESNIYCTIGCQQSADFVTWTDVPAAQINGNADGSHTARVPAAGSGKLFLRLKITVTP
jgi:lysophospholipase L1-like esterase